MGEMNIYKSNILIMKYNVREFMAGPEIELGTMVSLVTFSTHDPSSLIYYC